MSNRATGARSEVYVDEAGEWRWRYFGANGEELGRSSEGLAPDHGRERCIAQVVKANPGADVWVEHSPDTWVRLSALAVERATTAAVEDW